MNGEPLKESTLPTFEEEMQGNYRKIHKILGQDNRNKDVREELKTKLDEKPENHLSPNMWLTLNPVSLFLEFNRIIINVISNIHWITTGSLPSKEISKGK